MVEPGSVLREDVGNYWAGQTPSLPDARPHSDRFRCGGRKSEFLAVRSS